MSVLRSVCQGNPKVTCKMSDLKASLLMSGTQWGIKMLTDERGCGVLRLPKSSLSGSWQAHLCPSGLQGCSGTWGAGRREMSLLHRQGAEMSLWLLSMRCSLGAKRSVSTSSVHLGVTASEKYNQSRTPASVLTVLPHSVSVFHGYRYCIVVWYGVSSWGGV